MGFRLVAPTSVEDALRVLAEAGADRTAILAGGTDLLFDLDREAEPRATVLSLRRLGWSELRWGDGELVIGATAPLAALEDDPGLADRIPGLATAVQAVGSRALRHRATLGGNLGRASPASDLLPILIALEARVGLVGPDGTREMPVEQFVLGSRRTARAPLELIRSVRVPARRSSYLWQRVRPAHDISQVGVAASLDRTGRWCLAAGGVLPRPQRLTGAEDALHGIPDTAAMAEAIRRGRTEAAFVSDKRATETYRRHLLGILLGRAVRAIAPEGPA